MPARRAAHGEAGDYDAIRIDQVARLHIGEGFEDIGLAGKFRRIAEAARRRAEPSRHRCELAFALQSLLDEGELRQLVIPPVQPDPERARCARGEIPLLGNTRPYGCTEWSIRER
jgi:hypothetical protein